MFRGRWHWLPDPLWQAWDQVFPPVMLLARGGDDCDGWAMTHAQAVEAVLEAYGWHSWIVSYLADPWQESHHFAAAVDPRGRVWAIQPQPSILQRSDLQIVYGPYPSVGEAVRAIAAGYGAEVVWYDVRYPDWRPYIPNITPGSPASAGGFS